MKTRRCPGPHARGHGGPGDRHPGVLTRGFFALDRRGRFAFIDPGAEALLGRPSVELIGRLARDVLAGDDESWKRCHRASAEGGAVAFEVDVPLSGRRLSVQVEPSALGLSVYLDNADGAERVPRDSEARNGSMLGAAPDGIVAIDREGLIVEWNPAAEQIFGYRRDEVAG